MSEILLTASIFIHSINVKPSDSQNYTHGNATVMTESRCGVDKRERSDLRSYTRCLCSDKTFLNIDCSHITCLHKGWNDIELY